MSDRITSVRPKSGQRTKAGRIIPGLSAYGRKTRAEMIETYRRHYLQQLEEAQAALALADEDLIVHTYVGVMAQKNKQEVVE